jgi:hypothetical protein
MAKEPSTKAPRFSVELTDDLIYECEQRDSSHCMIADAIKRARPEATYVAVDLQTIRFTEGERRYTYLTPRRAQVAIVKFDQGIPCKPFTLQLRNGQSTLSGRRKSEPAKLVPPKSKKNVEGMVPDKLGGKTPPQDVRSIGNRRAFGLRALER